MSDELIRMEVPPALDGQRVDRGLALLLGLTRAQAVRLVDEGRAKVGRGTVKAGSRKLRSGERLRVEVPADASSWTASESAGPDEGQEAGPASPSASIVFADSDVVVVDKPAGLVVHPGAGNRTGTLVQQLLSLFPDMQSAGLDPDRPGIVHRIDKGTSGLLVVARSERALEGLASQMASHSTERRYLAIVHGEVDADEGMIDAPLGRSPNQRVKMAVVEGGRRALTHYEVCSRSSSLIQATLVACRLETGRTHQVRAHFAAIGHPVLDDDRYSKPSLLQLARRTVPELRRPALHAARLGFVHPVTGESMTFSSPLPDDIRDVAVRLGLPVVGF